MKDKNHITLDEIKTEGYNQRAVILLLETYEKRLRIIEQLIYEKQKQRKHQTKLSFENQELPVEL